MNTDDPLTAVQYGVGPIGSRIVETAVERGITFVGAIDIAPEKVGSDLGEIAGLGRDLNVEVTDNVQAALDTRPDVVFHSTRSSVADVGPQLQEALAAGADVISTTEELSYPWRANEETARDLDATAQENGVTCLGTGINPGFAMDTLPAVLSTPCRSVESIQVERVQDAAQRRKPLQEKIGAGMDTDTFEKQIGTAGGHIGLRQSIRLLAEAVGWELTDMKEEIKPVTADERIMSDHTSVEPGAVAGIHQTGRGIVDGKTVIDLNLQMYLGAADPRDHVRLTGRPDIDVTVKNGLHGDITTPAIVTNLVPRIREAAPGMATMLDLQNLSYSCQLS